MARGKSSAPAPRPQPQHWVDAEGGYALALHEGALVARNAKGAVLASVPKAVKEGPTAQRLLAALSYLDEHALLCRTTVEAWMLRSLPVPRAVLQAVWPDPAWRAVVEDAVVYPEGGDLLDAGFFKGVDPARGVGVVTLDGESRWLDAPALLLPHPVLLDEREEYRAFAVELGIQQGTPQLFREVFSTEGREANATGVGQFEGASFDQLGFALAECRKLGARVRAGWASLRIFEGGRMIEARLWVGEGDPSWGTELGELCWVDERGQSLTLGEVGPVAWSEGMRLGAALFGAAKKLEESDDAS
jgi:hypothetical protein